MSLGARLEGLSPETPPSSHLPPAPIGPLGSPPAANRGAEQECRPSVNGELQASCKVLSMGSGACPGPPELIATPSPSWFPLELHPAPAGFR